jgi:hypothetical protein
MIILYPATPLAIVLLCFVGLAVRPIGVFCLVLAAISGALTLAAYIVDRRQKGTPAGKAFEAWQAHCRTKRRSDLGKPDPVGDQLYAALQACRPQLPPQHPHRAGRPAGPRPARRVRFGHPARHRHLLHADDAPRWGG